MRGYGGWATTTQTAKLTASDAADGDGLGYSVAVNGAGTTVLAGAPNNTTAGTQLGAVYVFVRGANGWISMAQSDKIAPTDARSLGQSTAVSDDGYIVAGRPAYGGGGNVRGGVFVFGLPPTITSAAPPIGATVGIPYHFTLSANGTSPISFTLTNGALPPGLTLNGSTGVLSGIPTHIGSCAFSVSASNGIGAPATQDITVTVFPAVRVYISLVRR